MVPKSGRVVRLATTPVDDPFTTNIHEYSLLPRAERSTDTIESAESTRLTLDVDLLLDAPAIMIFTVPGGTGIPLVDSVRRPPNVAISSASPNEKGMSIGFAAAVEIEAYLASLCVSWSALALCVVSWAAVAFPSTVVDNVVIAEARALKFA